MSAPAVGIDLGTTYSCVAVCRNNTVEIIPNAEGNRITPSYVAFTKEERLVGEAAKIQEATNPTNTVFDAKRLIGRRFDDPLVQADMQQWPFEVVSEGGKPKIKVEFKGEEKTFYPEEVSSMVLGKMKATAEAYLGADVRRAVITVPAYFTDSQRQATKDAGAIAGLEVLRIINEPTAGALAYGLDKSNESDGDDDERNVLIFDLGGGTFDVSVLAIEEGIFEVRSTNGDTHLGGEDFDSRMVDYFVEEFQKKNNKDLREDKKALRRLRTACERAKRTLSSASEASIEIDMLHDGKDMHSTITRARFEEICEDLFRATLPPLQEVLHDAELEPGDINDVVLVGGSTRIPMIQKLLREYFPNKELYMKVNPDEAVAQGAAVQAAVLDGDTSAIVTDVVLVDVTPLSLGINVLGGVTKKLINRNSIIPCKKTQTFATAVDYQKEVVIQVYEGERAMSADNNLLGKFTLALPLAARGEIRVDVTYAVDTDGILNVTAVEQSTKKTSQVTITNDRGRLSPAEIDRLVEEAEQYKKEDEERAEVSQAKHALESYCLAVRARAESKQVKSKMPNAERQTVIAKCNAALKWLEENSKTNRETYVKKLAETESVCKPIMTSYV